MVQRSLPIHVLRTNPIERKPILRKKRRRNKIKKAILLLSMICIKVQLTFSMPPFGVSLSVEAPRLGNVRVEDGN